MKNGHFSKIFILFATICFFFVFSFVKEFFNQISILQKGFDTFQKSFLIFFFVGNIKHRFYNTEKKVKKIAKIVLGFYWLIDFYLLNKNQLCNFVMLILQRFYVTWIFAAWRTYKILIYINYGSWIFLWITRGHLKIL